MRIFTSPIRYNERRKSVIRFAIIFFFFFSEEEKCLWRGRGGMVFRNSMVCSFMEKVSKLRVFSSYLILGG